MEGKIMEATVLERRFRGQARLVRLLLWKIGESTDVDDGLSRAVVQNMVDPDDADFLRDCLQVEERDRDADHVEINVTDEMIARLQRCADKLNRADSA